MSSTASPAVSSQATALALVAQDMAQVDEVIAHRLSSGVPLVGQVAQYIISAGGKRLRPVILLLTCGALNYQDAHKFSMAAVVEFIHTATLLHDDVVDESTLRRGRPTANENFGNPASVLVGDFLYSRAFQMMVDAQSMRVMQTLADATNVIAEGEVLQLMNMHDASLDEEERWLLKQTYIRRYVSDDKWTVAPVKQGRKLVFAHDGTFTIKTCAPEKKTKAVRVGVGLQNVSIDQLLWRRQKIQDKEIANDLALFNQEYPSRPQLAFMSTGRPVFDIEKIDYLLAKARENQPKFVGSMRVEAQ